MPECILLLKPVSGSCNLNCGYCFYADVQANRSLPSYGKMSLCLFEKIVRQAMDFAEGQCTFAFQGGEPTLMGLDFYKEAVKIQKACQKKGVAIQNTIQTNGILIQEEWAEFFAQNHFLVGISLDGKKECHDRFRVNSKKEGTFTAVMRAIGLLKKYKAEFHILSVVNHMSAKSAGKNYNFFRRQGFQFLQYIECLDPIGDTPGSHDYSLNPKEYGEFLKHIFDLWYLDRMNGNNVSIRYFENLIHMLMGGIPESCAMRGTCGKQWVIEADGSVFPCDFYAGDEWILGNILEKNLWELDQKREEIGFRERSYEVPSECRGCSWFPLCRNGCYRHRAEGVFKENKNYFCEGYKAFFDYSYPRLIEVMERWYY